MSLDDDGKSPAGLDFTRRLNPISRPPGKKTLIGVGIVTAIGLALIVLFYAASVFGLRSEDARLKADGLDVTAVVLNHQTKSGSHSISYLVQVAFPVAAWGEPAHRAAIYMPQDMWLHLLNGQRVPVIYLRSNPDLVRLNFGDIYHKGDPHAAEWPKLTRFFWVSMAIFVGIIGFSWLKAFVLDDEPMRRGKKFGAVD